MPFDSFILAALLMASGFLFATNCAAYSCRISTSHTTRPRSRLYAGFGRTVPKENKKSGQEKLVNPQLKSIKEETICPCSSGRTYKDCCKVLHDGDYIPGNDPDPVMITRARYSSFAVGSASYIIDSTHSSHRDYKKHAGSHLDPKKARKAWEKEIVEKNSEVFDFLKLELLEGDEKSLQKRNEILSDGQESVSFRILVRKRSDGSLITFQESSIYVRKPANHKTLGSSTPNSSKDRKDSAESPILDERGWLYSHGVVTPVADDIAKRIMAEAPQFLNNLSIRDRW